MIKRIVLAIAALGLAASGYTLSIVGDVQTSHHSRVTASIVGDGHHAKPLSIVGD